MALTDNVIAYWNLNGNSNDATGNGHNGSDTSITYNSDGANFNGSSSNINIPASASLDLVYPMTLAFWVKTTSSALQVVFAGNNTVHTGNTLPKVYLFSASSNNPLFYRRANNNSNDAQPSLAGTTSVADGNLHLVLLTLTGTTATWYVDNTTAGTGTVTGTSISSLTNFSLGRFWNGSDGYSGYFNGSIRMGGLWSRVLDAGERTALYNGGVPFPYPFTNFYPAIPRRRLLMR